MYANKAFGTVKCVLFMEMSSVLIREAIRMMINVLYTCIS